MENYFTEERILTLMKEYKISYKEVMSMTGIFFYKAIEEVNKSRQREISLSCLPALMIGEMMSGKPSKDKEEMFKDFFV